MIIKYFKTETKRHIEDDYVISEFGGAPAKSGVGIDTPCLRRGISLSSVMVGCFGQPLRLAVSLCSGSVKPLWPATISLTPSGGSRENLIHRRLR